MPDRDRKYPPGRTPGDPGSPSRGGASLSDDWDRLFSGDQDAPAAAGKVLEAAPSEELEPQERYLSFRVGGESYAVPILHLSEVVNVNDITSVPRVRHFLRGIISVRGTIVPVVDLRRRLSDQAEGPAPAPEPREAATPLERHVLITTIRDERFGLLVDEISQVFALDSQEIEPPPPTLPRRLLEFVSGIIRVNARIHILLDLPAVLRFDAVGSTRSEGAR